jgi:hypothetical protein
MNDTDSLRLELEAERHNHRKDNEHFMSEIVRLRAHAEEANGAAAILRGVLARRDKEIERLRAALQHIANLPGWAGRHRDLACRALEEKT